jgi:hypothetical protein
MKNRSTYNASDGLSGTGDLRPSTLPPRRPFAHAITLAAAFVVLAGFDRKGDDVPPPPTRITKLEAVRAKYPTHPDQRFPYVRCTVRVWIDTGGLPYHADSKGCSQVFAEASEKALARWKFEPVSVDGVPVTAAGLVGVTYRLDRDIGRPPPPPPACEWRLTVNDTGNVTVATHTTSDGCAAWFPERVSEAVSLEGLTGRCVVAYQQSPPEFDPASCPETLQGVTRDLLDRALLAKSSTYTVRVDLPPARVER